MVRKILFRGKRLDNGEWSLGDLLQYQDSAVIHAHENGCRMSNSINGATIGQYTGLTGKKGVKIFEGDIAQYNDELVAVEWDDCDAMFCVRSLDGTNWVTDFAVISEEDLEVIGNIHDNPELLEEARP